MGGASQAKYSTKFKTGLVSAFERFYITAGIGVVVGFVAPGLLPIQAPITNCSPLCGAASFLAFQLCEGKEGLAKRVGRLPLDP